MVLDIVPPKSMEASHGAASVETMERNLLGTPPFMNPCNKPAMKKALGPGPKPEKCVTAKVYRHILSSVSIQPLTSNFVPTMFPVTTVLSLVSI